MKDLAHHLKKLNRRVIRSAHREEMEEDAFETTLTPARKQTKKAVKKIAKQKQAKVRKTRAATPLTPAERNKKMKKRVPVFDQPNRVKAARSSKKKTPRI